MQGERGKRSLILHCGVALRAGFVDCAVVAYNTKYQSMSTEANRKRTVVIVDDHPLVRERLVELICREKDLDVLGEAEDRSAAFALIERCRPDLAIVDLTLKSSLGMDLIKDVRAAFPGVKILVVSMQDEMLHAERCIRAGASGYITKQEASRSILHAIRTVLAGKIHLGEEVAAGIIRRTAGLPTAGRSMAVPELLADRELQVFEMLGGGFSTRQIAERLAVEVKTIETYRARIKEKLGLKDSSELLQKAISWSRDQSWGG